MENFVWIGRLGGFAGILVFLIATVTRLTGQYFLAGFQLTTLIQVAIAGMIFACFCFLLVMTSRKTT